MKSHVKKLEVYDPAVVKEMKAGKRVLIVSTDPEREVAANRDEVPAKVRGGLDAAGRAMLEEDSRSPCTKEIAVVTPRRWRSPPWWCA